MTTVKSIYKKQRSYLEGWQEKSETLYSLVETEAEDQIMYGIQLIEIQGMDRQSDAWFEISESEIYVRELLTLLFENAIMIDVWRDIVWDVITEIYL